MQEVYPKKSENDGSSGNPLPTLSQKDLATDWVQLTFRLTKLVERGPPVSHTTNMTMEVEKTEAS